MAKPVRFTPEMIAHYRQAGWWTSDRISDYWDKNAAEHPDREAIADSRVRLTWAQAKQWIDRIALGLLDLGFARDEMLTVQLPNCVELVLLRMATERACVLCLPVLRTFRQAEMEYILRHTRSAGLVIPWRYRGFDYFQMVQEMRPRLPDLKHVIVAGDDVPSGATSLQGMVEKPLEQSYPAGYLKQTACPPDEYSLVLASSGTTGFPRFAEHPIYSRVYIGKVYAEGWRMTGGDVVGILGPAASGPNHAAYWSAPLVGARMVVLEHFEAEAALQLIEKERITFTGFVPAQLALLLRHPNFGKYDLSSLRLVVSAGAPLGYKLGVEAESRLGCPIVQAYGAIESGGSIMHYPEDPQEVRLLTAGHPIPGVEVKIVDDSGDEAPRGEVGEIWVRGPTFVSGFYKDPEATASGWTHDGWFRMGDLGKWDDRGNIAIVGRKKDMIIRGGQNIYPVEIENILVAHPKVAGVAIVGMPDPVMGERACAFVIPRPAAKFTFEEMVSFLKEKHIAMFKIPERLELAESLPMVADDQKVDKKVLAQVIRDKLASEGKT